MYAKIKDGSVEKYPYSITDLKQDNPNVSFPKVLDSTTLNSFGTYEVVIDSRPTYNSVTQTIKKKTIPELESGVWALKWEIKDKPQEDIDQETLNRERAIYENQAKDSGKPQEIMEKMVEGKVNRFLSEVSLLSQGFVKDPDITIEKYLANDNASVVSFDRLKVGEGIEVETKDFAEEVAEQLK